MAIKLNPAGTKNANARIAAGDVDVKSRWDIGPEDTTAFLGENGDDWANYAKWFLAIDTDADPKTKAAYRYPFGMNGKVYRSGLIAIRSRAGQEKETDVFDAAGKMIEAIDAKSEEGKFFEHYYTTSQREAYEKFFRVNRGGKSVIGVRSAFATTVEKAAGLQDGQLRCLISTSTPDRCNDVMNPKGVDAKAFVTNPTVLWMHDPFTPSIGACVRGTLKVLPNGIEAIVQFDLKDPFAAQIYRKYVDGFLFAFSIGFIPVEWEDDSKTGTRTYTKYELLEFSCVTTPMNAEALVTELPTKSVAEAAKQEATTDDALAAQIDAAQKSALEAASLDFADPDNVQKFLDGVAALTATLNGITHSLTTTPNMENTTNTTPEVVEKASVEISKENGEALKGLHKSFAAAHKAFGKACEDMKAFLVSKGHDVEPDGDEANPTENNDGDADNDPFETEKGKALVANVAALTEAIAEIKAAVTPKVETPVVDPVEEYLKSKGLA